MVNGEKGHPVALFAILPASWRCSFLCTSLNAPSLVGHRSPVLGGSLSLANHVRCVSVEPIVTRCGAVFYTRFCGCTPFPVRAGVPVVLSKLKTTAGRKRGQGGGRA